MATTGIYWCLVLTECLSFLVLAVVLFQQTEPNASTVLCLGDRVEFTCQTDTSSVIWQTDGGRITEVSSLTVPSQIDSLLLAVSHFNGSMITSTATIESKYSVLYFTLMATAGIYWCLVLTECLSLAVSTITSYEQSPPTACPGDKLVFACVTVTEGSVIWRLNGNNSQAALLANDSPPSTLGSFSLKVTQYNIATLEIVSTATSTSAPVSLNGTSIDCSGTGGASYQRRFISYGDVPESINNTTIDPINSNALIINWSASGSCIDNYTVTIISNSTFNESRTTNNTNITIDTLIIGTNYSFIIIPIDTIGREGPPSSLISYIWNVPAQVVNISWDQISTNSITIWWNNIEDTTTLRPPIDYNVTDTNTTITGLSPINEYYTVTIIPVNVIGYGPSVTVNVSITTTTSSITNIMMSTTEYITMQDKSSAMTALPTITETQLITTTETISSCPDSSSSCITTTMSQSTDVGFISVAIAVPITGLLTGLITAIITSIIVCLIMKKRGTTIQNKTPVGGGGEAAVIGPIYCDLPTINTEQQEEQIIDAKLNTAYGQANI
uniref:Fibronectin type-III domain-containing protein n=1 Tax=Amphimedon queenslandica TaxID=400682 RepID=A0A1X7UNS6_AMPQE